MHLLILLFFIMNIGGDLYNPYVYDNYRLLCSGKYVHEPIRYIEKVKNARTNKVLNDE